MYSFKNDYTETAHPRILKAIVESNMEQDEGYGLDRHCMNAARLIRERIGSEADAADVHFLCGGTQANMIALSSFLRPYEAIVAAETAHICVHETGAIEGTGHKILAVPTKDGKVRPRDVRCVLDLHTDEHMVKPRLVKISNSTEIGSVYTKKELEELSAFCREKNLYLYADGARLGSALSVEGSDVTLADMYRCTDAFYIGGTKNGAMIGEALILKNDPIKDEFRYYLKHKGGMLAKGRLLGVQFEELFRDNLYFELAAHANKMAQMLAEGLRKAGFRFLSDSPSNQIFPILPNEMIKRLQKNWNFTFWQKLDESSSAIRLVASWATAEEMVRTFIDEIRA